MEIVPLTRDEEKAFGLSTLDGVFYHRMRCYFAKIIERGDITPKEKIETTMKLTNLYRKYRGDPPEVFVTYLNQTFKPKQHNFTPVGYFLSDLMDCIIDGTNNLGF